MFSLSFLLQCQTFTDIQHLLQHAFSDLPLCYPPCFFSTVIISSKCCKLQTVVWPSHQNVPPNQSSGHLAGWSQQWSTQYSSWSLCPLVKMLPTPSFPPLLLALPSMSPSVRTIFIFKLLNISIQGLDLGSLLTSCWLLEMPSMHLFFLHSCHECHHHSLKQRYRNQGTYLFNISSLLHLPSVHHQVPWIVPLILF